MTTAETETSGHAMTTAETETSGRAETPSTTPSAPSSAPAPPTSPGDRTSPARPASRLRSIIDAAGERSRTVLQPIWNDWRIGVAAGGGLAVAWGLLAGWWTPRSPLTPGEALWSMVISVTVGALAGVLMRSRWAMLVVPVTFAAVFELVRMDLEGPTVDGIQTSFYGLIALVVGRGFHALLSLAPMFLGAMAGAAFARQPSSIPGDRGPHRRRGWRYVRRSVAVLAAVGFVATFALIAQPASTDRIVDADGEVVVGSIAELTTVDVNGHDLAMMIRGHSVGNPVLLFLAGGPGGSEIGAMRNHLSELEQHFTVVTWDQRGAGKSYAELDSTDTITLDGYVDDTIEVTDYLRDRFEQDQIYVLGQSWGTTLGVLAVQQRPELYRAFIGTGQMVSQLATDRIMYADTLAWARAEGDDGLVEDLEAIGAPPYDEMLNYETALAHEQDVYRYDHSPNSEGEGQMSENLIADEYTLIDEVHILGAFMDTFAALYPHLQDIDFRETATDFDVPMFFAQGANEAGGRAEMFDEWYPMVDAPVKERVTLDTSGHRPLFEQPDEFVDFVVDTVLAATDPTGETTT